MSPAVSAGRSACGEERGEEHRRESQEAEHHVRTLSACPAVGEFVGRPLGRSAGGKGSPPTAALRSLWAARGGILQARGAARADPRLQDFQQGRVAEGDAEGVQDEVGVAVCGRCCEHDAEWACAPAVDLSRQVDGESVTTGGAGMDDYDRLPGVRRAGLRLDRVGRYRGGGCCSHGTINVTRIGGGNAPHRLFTLQAALIPTSGGTGNGHSPHWSTRASPQVRASSASHDGSQGQTESHGDDQERGQDGTGPGKSSKSSQEGVVA